MAAIWSFVYLKSLMSAGKYNFDENGTVSICCFPDNGRKPPSIDLFWSRPCQARPTTLSWCYFVRVVKIFMKETFKNLNIHEQNAPKKYIFQPLVQMVKDKTRCQVMNMILLIPRSVEMVILPWVVPIFHLLLLWYYITSKKQWRSWNYWTNLSPFLFVRNIQFNLLR